MRNDAICKVLETIADDLHLRCCIDQWYAPHKIFVKFTDENKQTVEIHNIDIFEFDEHMADKIRSSLMEKVNSNEAEKKAELVGWRPVSEYSREKYDWVLVKYFDRTFECVPEVAEMRADGKWYNRSGILIPDILEVRYFFDMQQLDKKEVME